MLTRWERGGTTPLFPRVSTPWSVGAAKIISGGRFALLVIFSCHRLQIFNNSPKAARIISCYYPHIYIWIAHFFQYPPHLGGKSWPLILVSNPRNPKMLSKTAGDQNIQREATPHFLPHSPFLSHFVAMVATSETAVARRQRTSQSFQSFSFFRRWLFIMFFCFHESLSLSPDPPSISVCINIFLRWWQRRPDVALLHCAFFTPPAICVLSSGASCEGVLTSQHALWRVFAKLSCIVLLSSLPVRISRAFGKPVGLYICRECFRSHTNVSDQTRTFPTGSLNELFEGSFWHACVWRGRWPSLDCCFLGRGRKSGVFEYGTPIFSGGCVEKSSLTSFRWAFALNDPLDPTPVLYKFDVQVFCWCTPFSRLVFTAFMESWAHVISIW